mmetsp:Transcript_57098/g.105572  ORF Transcript_57098/g.105572 Transcript_57098/m.105572 type:complete len:164 (-) Transcript_57098:53-544(-)
MSGNPYGSPWHSALMRPVTHAHISGEAFPKAIPADGCGFRGVPGDFAPEKVRWYMDEVPAAGDTRRRFQTIETSLEPRVVKLPSEPARSSSVVSLPGASRLPTPTEVEGAEVKGRRAEKSHMYLMHGRRRTPDQDPSCLRHAGVATFDFRRYHVTAQAKPQSF